MVLATYPYVAIPLTAALRSIDAGHEEAAQSSGWDPWPSRVVSPFLAWPAAAAGVLLAALYIDEFGTVAIFRVDAFTRVIYTAYRASFDRDGGGAVPRPCLPARTRRDRSAYSRQVTALAHWIRRVASCTSATTPHPRHGARVLGWSGRGLVARCSRMVGATVAGKPTNRT